MWQKWFSQGSWKKKFVAQWKGRSTKNQTIILLRTKKDYEYGEKTNQSEYYESKNSYGSEGGKKTWKGRDAWSWVHGVAVFTVAAVIHI